MLLRRTLAAGTLAALPLALVPPLVDAADAADTAAAAGSVHTERIRKSVTVGGILAHERVFQRIANNNDGTRASGTPGFKRSAHYVARRLDEAGYRVRVQEFTFPFFRELSPAVLQQISPEPGDFETATFDYSGTGDVTGDLAPINLTLPPPTEAGTSPSGCSADDFPDPGAEPAVALIQRGTCFFADKVANAEAAGYDAVVIFNEGQEGRTELLTGTLTDPVDIPVVGLSYADGAALAAQLEEGAVTVRVATQTEFDPAATTYNVLGTSRRGNPEKTVVVGAHLDSVVPGPGINDNGSGSATILEIAEEMSELGIKPRQRVRFAFWGAEEAGLLGSTHYVDSLSDRQLSQIAANLNFDMLGSPNYVRFVYDGDGSATDPAGPPGSGAIEDVFTEYFADQGLASEPTQFSGRSDYGPFIAVGIPAGGLFSGAEGIKTEEEAEVYGGTAGEAYDACYHQACDDITNLNTAALSELGDAAAHAVVTLARTRSGLFEDGSLRSAHRARADTAPLATSSGHARR